MARLLWTQKHNFGAYPRFGHVLAFDSNRSQVVLFGGLTTIGALGDTWAWDGEDWTQLNDIGPSATGLYAMAYDRNRSRIVLFGGAFAPGASGETWEWDGQNWTQVAETGPPARQQHAMAFDSTKNVVTLFGGILPKVQTTLNDTWEWDGQNWTQQEDTGPARCGHGLAYDDVRKRLVLFGGTDENGSQYGDTWEWDRTTWTQRSDFGPPACSGARLVFTGRGCAMFGGTHGNALQRQTWTWDGTYWTARQDMGPTARNDHATAFDSVRQRVVLFGGRDQALNLLGDTWEQNADAGQTTGPTGLTLSSFTVTALQAHIDPHAFEGQATVQLSGPAPSDGVVIGLSVDQVNDQFILNAGSQATVPAGQTTTTIQVGVIVKRLNTIVAVTFTATLQNGDSLQATTQLT